MMNRMYELGIKSTFRFTAFDIFILFEHTANILKGRV